MLFFRPNEYFLSLEKDKNHRGIFYSYFFAITLWIVSAILKLLPLKNNEYAASFYIASEIITVLLFLSGLFIISYITNLVTKENSYIRSLRFILYCFFPVTLGRALSIFTNMYFFYHAGSLLALVLLFMGIRKLYRESNPIFLIFVILILSMILYGITSIISLSFIDEILLNFF